MNATQFNNQRREALIRKIEWEKSQEIGLKGDE